MWVRSRGVNKGRSRVERKISFLKTSWERPAVSIRGGEKEVYVGEKEIRSSFMEQAP